MLFDLRSRGRRRAVQIIYVGLAFLMFFGLVLFGVGAGNGFGGLLNAFTGGGSGGNGAGLVDTQLKAAQKAAQRDPQSAAAWANLLTNQWQLANQGGNLDTNGTYSADGNKLLRDATQSWQRYVNVAHAPQFGVAVLAAHAYEHIANYAGAASAWEYAAAAEPKSAGGFLCLAANAYAAGLTRKGDLAAARVAQLSPTVQKLTLKDQLKAARSSPQTAKLLVLQSC
jgi:hypothetical protein